MALRPAVMALAVACSACFTSLAPGGSLKIPDASPSSTSGQAGEPMAEAALGTLVMPLGAQSGLAGQVEFDHGCAAERVRLIRSRPSGSTVDLDVCGVVRRYRSTGYGWMDVTINFPASALPGPLSP